MGRRHRPFYRVAAMDARRARDSRVIEELGYYDPLTKSLERRFVVKADRVQYWLSVGAQPSDTVKSLLTKAGVVQ